MIGRLAVLLMSFRQAFPREATFSWFVVAIIGFIVRLDHHGVSSTIRWLRIGPELYETFLAFFRSQAMRIKTVQEHWQLHVANRYPIRTSCGKRILIGDGIKISKEARYMPGVKKLHQESDNSGKAPWIFGHHFGVVGVLAGNTEKSFCVPLGSEVHEGAATLRELQGKPSPKVNGNKKTTISTLMANYLAAKAELFAEPCVGVLDAYFAVAPVFKIAKATGHKDGQRLLHIITRAKDNVTANEVEPPAYSGRGRPPEYGKKLKLKKLFDSRANEFVPVTINIYDEPRTVLILCLDLFWKSFGDTLRFVLVQDGAQRFIVISSDLAMPPEEIVSLYSKRFKIEVSFKMIKHLIGGFDYHFWTKAWQIPKNKTLSNEDLKEMPQKTKQLITGAVNAVEAFVNMALIATGLLQVLAIENADYIQKRHCWWMRTISNDVPSEEMVKRIIQHEFYHNFRKFKHTAIYRIIQDKRRPSAENPLKRAA